jgi:hypothetical protein
MVKENECFLMLYNETSICANDCLKCGSTVVLRSVTRCGNLPTVQVKKDRTVIICFQGYSISTSNASSVTDAYGG